MTIAKIRNLSEVGVINDVDPYNLPPNGFSMAVNARFDAGSVKRAPVFRSVSLSTNGGALLFTSPRFLTSNLPAAGFDTLYPCYLNGRVTQVVTGAETDISIFGFANNNSETPFTSQMLQQVFYIN